MRAVQLQPLATQDLAQRQQRHGCDAEDRYSDALPISSQLPVMAS
jgi:hypothetical protein